MTRDFRKFAAVAAIGLTVAVGSTDVHAADIYTLKFYHVDDVMNAYISNDAVQGELVLSKNFGYDYAPVDISSYIRPGLNTLDLLLFNGPSGWTYGYDFQKNGVSISSGSCGTFNVHGCNDDEYKVGLVWNKSISFYAGDGSFGAVPEPSSWAMMIAGFAGIGAMRRYRRRSNRLAIAG